MSRCSDSNRRESRPAAARIARDWILAPPEGCVPVCCAQYGIGANTDGDLCTANDDSGRNRLLILTSVVNQPTVRTQFHNLRLRFPALCGRRFPVQRTMAALVAIDFLEVMQSSPQVSGARERHMAGKLSPDCADELFHERVRERDMGNDLRFGNLEYTRQSPRYSSTRLASRPFNWTAKFLVAWDADSCGHCSSRGRCRM